MAKILLGVSGGIAAFKSVTLLRELGRRGHEVRVAATPSALKFVGADTFEGLLGAPILSALFGQRGEPHVALGAWAECVVIAPLTMNTLGRIRAGLADDPITASLACAAAPLVVAPAMHHRMWSQPSTQDNIAWLRTAMHAHVVGPESGALASGEIAMGRMSEPAQIADAVDACLAGRGASTGPWSGKRVLVSAGPTHEDLDPVRFLGNRSTGKMGYAIAAAAAAQGAEVILVSGPVRLPTPAGVTRVDVRTALQMQRAIDHHRAEADVIFMAAAVADYRPANSHAQKLKKAPGDLTLTLTRNPDILQALGETRLASQSARPVLVGFALETESLLENARSKLARKHVDLIVANLAEDSFGKEDNQVHFVSQGGAQRVPRAPKAEIAHALLAHVYARFFAAPQSAPA